MDYARFAALVMTVAILVLGGRPAFASDPEQEQQDDPGAIAAAQKHFDDGVASYKANDYPTALHEFRQAYAKIPAAVFLYNAARVAEKMDNFQESLNLAKRAQSQTSRPLPAPLREKNTALIKSLEQKRARDKAAREAHQKRNQPQRFDRNPVTKKLPKMEKSPVPNTAGNWSALGYTGGAVAVVGLGLVGTSVYLGADASSRIDSLNAIDDPVAFTQEREDIDSQQSTGQILLYSGVGAVALGGAMIAWDLIGSEARPARSEANDANDTNDDAKPISIAGVSMFLAPDASNAGVSLRGTY